MSFPPATPLASAPHQPLTDVFLAHSCSILAPHSLPLSPHMAARFALGSCPRGSRQERRTHGARQGGRSQGRSIRGRRGEESPQHCRRAKVEGARHSMLRYTFASSEQLGAAHAHQRIPDPPSFQQLRVPDLVLIAHTAYLAQMWCLGTIASSPRCNAVVFSSSVSLPNAGYVVERGRRRLRSSSPPAQGCPQWGWGCGRSPKTCAPPPSSLPSA